MVSSCPEQRLPHDVEQSHSTAAGLSLRLECCDAAPDAAGCGPSLVYVRLPSWHTDCVAPCAPGAARAARPDQKDGDENSDEDGSVDTPRKTLVCL